MILGVERECRRRVRAACGWFSDGRVSRSGESLARVLLRKVLIDSGEPKKGDACVPRGEGDVL